MFENLFKKISPKQRLWKNFIAFNLSFLLLFAASDDISSVTSILNQNEGLGNSSQAIIYIFMLLLSFVWPQLTIELVGFKKALMLAEIGFILYFIANMFPSWFTLIPTSVLLGFSYCQVWTTLGIYFTILSKRYAVIQGIKFIDAQTMLFGGFGVIFFLNRVLGSIWLAVILQLKELPVNSTFNYAESCGANNYPQTKLPEATSKPTIKSIYILFATIIASGVLALIITFLFVDDINTDENKDELAIREKINVELIKNRFKIQFNNFKNIAKKLDMWLMLPVTLFLGYELTVIWFEYTRGFVSCLKNVNYVGWCIMVYAVSASINSFLISRLTKYTGVQTMLVIMLLAALCQAIFMISWTARLSEAYVIFIMAANFGITQSLANTQIRAVFGLFFPDDPTAYSGAILFETMGLILGSVLSIFLQTRIKVYVYIGIIFTSLFSYMWLEARNSRRLVLMVEGDLDDEEPKTKNTSSMNGRVNESFRLENASSYDEENVKSF